MKQSGYHFAYEKGQIKPSKLDSQFSLRLFTYLKPYRMWLALALVILIATKIIEAYVPIYTGRIAQSILDSTPFGDEEKMHVIQVVFQGSVTIFSLLIFAYLLDTLNVYLKNWIGQQALYKLRLEIYSHIQKLPLEYYNRHPVGTLMTRTVHDVDQISQMFSEGVVPLIGSLLLFISIAFFLLILDWRSACVLIGILPFVFFMTNAFRKQQRICYERVRTILSALNAFFQEHLMGFSTIRSFGLEREEKEHFDKINEDHRLANVQTIHYFAKFFAEIDLIQSIALIALFVLLIQFSAGEFEAGTYFTFSLYVLMLFRPLSDLVDRYNLLQSAAAAGRKIFDVLDQPLENSGPFPGEELHEITSLEFEEVWFAYRGEEWVLKGFSFSIQKGESVALMGVTGAGKTSIINLIMRFYDHQRGSIKINGKEIGRYAVADVRRQFSLVLQDPEIFSGTIGDNISLMRKEFTAAQVEEAARFVNLSTLFPEGIGHRLLERGKSLSAGEKQLISLARAVLHQGSGMILDEATANIDSHSEKMIQDVLKKILSTKTSIVIAHRLSTIKDVSRIIVIHLGKAAETGTHTELLQKKGIYEKLYRLQYPSG